MDYHWISPHRVRPTGRTAMQPVFKSDLTPIQTRIHIICCWAIKTCELVRKATRNFQQGLGDILWSQCIVTCAGCHIYCQHLWPPYNFDTIIQFNGDSFYFVFTSATSLNWFPRQQQFLLGIDYVQCVRSDRAEPVHKPVLQLVHSSATCSCFYTDCDLCAFFTRPSTPLTSFITKSLIRGCLTNVFWWQCCFCMAAVYVGGDKEGVTVCIVFYL